MSIGRKGKQLKIVQELSEALQGVFKGSGNFTSTTNFNSGTETTFDSAKKRIKEYAGVLYNSVENESQFNNAMKQFASMMYDFSDGIGKDEMLLPNSVTTDGRKLAIGQIESNLESVIGEAIQVGSRSTLAGERFAEGSELKTFAQFQDQRNQSKMYKTLSASGGSNAGQVSKYMESVDGIYEDTLKKILGNFDMADFNSSIITENGVTYIEAKKRTTDKRTPIGGKGFRTREANTIKIEIPTLTENHEVMYGGGRKILRTMLKQENGNIYATNNLVEGLLALEQQTRNLQGKLENIQSRNIVEAFTNLQSRIQNRINDKVSPVFASSSTSAYDAKREFDVKNPISSAIKSNQIDVTEVVEGILDGSIGQLPDFLQPYGTQVAVESKAKRISPIDALVRGNKDGQKQARYLLAELAEQVKDLTGINMDIAWGGTNADYTKNLMGTPDADHRAYQSMGFLYDPTTENSQKTSNFYGLETSQVSKHLSTEGAYSYRVDNSFISEHAYDKLKGPEGQSVKRGLQLQTDFMTDAQLALKATPENVARWDKIIDEELASGKLTRAEAAHMKASIKSLPSATTSEGRAIISIDALKGFAHDQEVKFKFYGDNATDVKFAPVIEEILGEEAKRRGIDGDWKTQTIFFDEAIELSQEQLNSLADNKGK
ncbi:MAG: hypothetical protein ACRC5C_10040, partial [Bacilli bacterium]